MTALITTYREQSKNTSLAVKDAVDERLRQIQAAARAIEAVMNELQLKLGEIDAGLASKRREITALMRGRAAATPENAAIVKTQNEFLKMLLETAGLEKAEIKSSFDIYKEAKEITESGNFPKVDEMITLIFAARAKEMEENVKMVDLLIKLGDADLQNYLALRNQKLAEETEYFRQQLEAFKAAGEERKRQFEDHLNLERLHITAEETARSQALEQLKQTQTHREKMEGIAVGERVEEAKIRAQLQTELSKNDAAVRMEAYKQDTERYKAAVGAAAEAARPNCVIM